MIRGTLEISNGRIAQSCNDINLNLYRKLFTFMVLKRRNNARYQVKSFPPDLKPHCIERESLLYLGALGPGLVEVERPVALALLGLGLGP